MQVPNNHFRVFNRKCLYVDIIFIVCLLGASYTSYVEVDGGYKSYIGCIRE